MALAKAISFKHFFLLKCRFTYKYIKVYISAVVDVKIRRLYAVILYNMRLTALCIHLPFIFNKFIDYITYGHSEQC